MKSGKQHMSKGMELTIKEEKKEPSEKRNAHIFENIGSDTIKHMEMKGKIKTECLRRTRDLLETQIYGRSSIKGINSLAVPLVRYSAPFSNWTREELNQMEKRKRKLMTIHKALHHRYDVNRLYV